VSRRNLAIVAAKKTGYRDFVALLDRISCPAFANEERGTACAYVPGLFAAVLFRYFNVITNMWIFEPDFANDTVKSCGFVREKLSCE